jgi:hypothetical protein
MLHSTVSLDINCANASSVESLSSSKTRMNRAAWVKGSKVDLGRMRLSRGGAKVATLLDRCRGGGGDDGNGGTVVLVGAALRLGGGWLGGAPVNGQRRWNS